MVSRAGVEPATRDLQLAQMNVRDWTELVADAGAETVTSPLHESLLLDAHLESESDPRIGVLYAALACEVFIQSWLEEMSTTDGRLKRWLEWTDPRRSPEGNISTRSYYDIGVFLAEDRSIRDDRELSNSLDRLLGARNDVAHRGRLPANSVS